MFGNYIGKTNNGLLPNITGYFSLRGTSNLAGDCFYRSIDAGAVCAGTGSTAESPGYVFINASRSSAIYGGNGTTSPGWYDGTRVIPSSVGMPYIIKY